MQNKKIAPLKLFIVVGISVITHSLHSTVGVYLENNYGATLNYKISEAKPEGNQIGNNVRVFIGDVDFVPELAIRTTGTGSSYVSRYYDLTPILQGIKLYQDSHKNEDAIISVNASRVSWDVTSRWEPKTKGLKPFEYKEFSEKPKSTPVDESQKKEAALMALTTADQRLDAIKNGALGPEFAQKAKEICNANYAQAEKLGKINLCSELKRSLVAPVYHIDKRALQKGTNPDLAPAIEEIKASINRLHGALARYKSRGEAL